MNVSSIKFIRKFLIISGPIQPGYVGQPQFVPQRSSWRDYASLIVIVGGTSYAAFRLIRVSNDMLVQIL